MTKQATVTLTGASNHPYQFEVFPWATRFNRVGAVYAILRHRPEGNFDILYIGQTGDLSERFADHHKQTCCDRLGKTHIGVHPEPGEARRFTIETDLVRRYRPPCND